MKTKKESSKVKVSSDTSDTIMAAIAGDKNAIAKILSTYDPYIKEMSIIKNTDDEGKEIFTLDKDLMQHLRVSLIEAIPKFKPVVK